MNSKAIHSLSPFSRNDISYETAVYEAGHATAIYLGNKQRQLPPIFFQIAISPSAGKMGTEWGAKIDGGRLIHTLPSSINEATWDFTEAEKKAYRVAFEADIVNLLVGPLAEAKYLALRDNEPVKPRMIHRQHPQCYGGTSDLEIIHEYLECFIAEKTERTNKIAELFLTALNFVNNPTNWRAILALADYILRAGKESIDCEEAGFVISQQLA